MNHCLNERKITKINKKFWFFAVFKLYNNINFRAFDTGSIIFKKNIKF